MVDLDAELKGLRQLKARLDKLFDGGVLDRLVALDQRTRADAPTGSTDPDPRVDDLGKHVSELAETVTRVQQALDKLPETIAAALDEALKPYQAQMAAVEKLAEPAVLDLLDWLARNRESLDVLLSLGDTVDGTDDAADPDGKPATGGDPAPDGATGADNPQTSQARS